MRSGNLRRVLKTTSLVLLGLFAMLVIFVLALVLDL